jgi:subtilisin family serine protease
VRLPLRVPGVALVIAIGSASLAHGQTFQAQSLEPTGTQSLPKSARGEVSVIVKFQGDPMATYAGGIPGFPGTSAAVTGTRRLDPTSPAARAYEAWLALKEQNFEQAVRGRIAGARVVHRFRKILGGVTVVLPADRVKEIAALPGVEAVYPDVLLTLDTNRSVEFIGAPALWNKVGGEGKAGEGVIVGIIDSGIWPEHPSLADTGYPEPPAKWTGTACQFGSAKPGDAPFTCNNKLIGASRHMTTFDTFGPPPLPGEFFTARDNNGHGSHVATTAAGNADVPAPTGNRVTGVAPRAHVAAYKVCFTNAMNGQGQCFTSDSAAAVEQAIEDGVDVLNFSVGGGANPYTDVVSLAFLDAYAAGIFVAAAAGNSGPAANTTDHREPWVTTVAATTTDKGFGGSASLSAGGGAALTVTGASATVNLSSAAPVVLARTVEDGVMGGGPACMGIAEDESEALCCNPFPAGSLAGKVAVCKRGTNARVSKSFNVAAGGAVGMILYNVDPTINSINPDVHAVPSVHIDVAQGTSLLAFLGANPAASATIAGGSNDFTGQGDVMADFSSRGGPGQTLGISKPDVGAPGVNILAGNTNRPAFPDTPAGQLFQIISGTSMASPHVAGAGALLRQLHPDWTPGQIKSALMMTATTENTVKEDGTTPTTPFDIGSGRIDLTRAGKPGLTISETAENFILLQNNLFTANYPSLYVPVLAGKAVVERTLKSVDSRTRQWKIDVDAPPDVRILTSHQVTLRRGQERDIVIFVDASQVPLGETRHASLQFKGGHGHDDVDLVFPITVVRRQGDVTLNKVCEPLVFPKGGTTTCTIDATNTTFEDQSVSIFDLVPFELDVNSISGGFRLGNLVLFNGTLTAAVPPQVSIDPGDSPAGYLPLAPLGVPKQPGIGDETIVNFNTPPFVFAGTTYTRLGVVSNGYLVVGGGAAADVQFLNQNLPNPARPNNVLAPFWTDLNPGMTGPSDGIRVATLSDGVNTWLVVDYQNVPNFTMGTGANSFQVWIGLNGVEDISYTYGPVTMGDGELLTVGAENLFGNSGENFYFNGTGMLPNSTTQLRVTGTAPQPGETHRITFTARGRRTGQWRNCAEMFSDAVFGVATSCVSGEVTKR